MGGSWAFDIDLDFSEALTKFYINALLKNWKIMGFKGMS